MDGDEHKRAPIFLANNKKALDATTVSAIKTGRFSRVIIMGGTAAVSDSVKTQLAGIECIRISGATAVGTSIAMAKQCLAEGMTANGLAFATSGGYYDALVGAPLCGKRTAPLLLISDSDRSAINNFLAPRKNQVSNALVLGGESAVRKATYQQLIAATW